MCERERYNSSYSLQGTGENDFIYSVSLQLLFTTLYSLVISIKDVGVNLKSRPSAALIIYKKIINDKIEKKNAECKLVASRVCDANFI